jgi:hypothetical protein
MFNTDNFCESLFFVVIITLNVEDISVNLCYISESQNYTVRQ